MCMHLSIKRLGRAIKSSKAAGIASAALQSSRGGTTAAVSGAEPDQVHPVTTRTQRMALTSDASRLSVQNSMRSDAMCSRAQSQQFSAHRTERRVALFEKSE